MQASPLAMHMLPNGEAKTTLKIKSRYCRLKRLFTQKVRFYSGVHNGQVVATSMTFFSAGVAGIYFVSVIPELRNRGMGRKMMLRCIYDAQELGYNYCILQATDIGEHLYRSLGFELCGTLKYFFFPDVSVQAFLQNNTEGT